MRQKKAKALRRLDPSRPNPGRKHGGAGKVPGQEKMVPDPVPMADNKKRGKR